MIRLLALLVIITFIYQDRSDSIVWHPDLELQWSNFKGNPKPSDKAVALTASGITFALSTKKTDTQLIDFTYQIQAVFYPEKSWYVNRPLSDIVLDHERLHFDITELFARKFKKQISESQFTINISAEIKDIYDSINEELDDMQRRYDLETNHSQNIKKQKEWEQLVALEIHRLSHYK
jgi:hypothetical protein